MGELKIIIWIILGVIYLVSRAKKKQVPDSASPAKPVDDYREDKPISFEELLKEIQSSKAPKHQPVLEPEPAYKVEDYVDPKEKAKPIEDTNYNYRDQDTIYETYEKAKQEAFLRPSMEETLKLENTVVRYGQFKGYEQQVRPSLAREYGKDLKDRTNFRKAFVLSEILNRRF